MFCWELSHHVKSLFRMSNLRVDNPAITFKLINIFFAVCVTQKWAAKERLVKNKCILFIGEDCNSRTAKAVHR